MDKKIEINVGGEIIRGVLENTNSEKIIILAHGFTGTMNGPKNLFKKLSKELQKIGFTVLRFNFIGTPDSDGEFKDMTVGSETRDLQEILKFVRKSGYTKIGILGESMGGTIVANCIYQNFDFIIFFYSAFELIDTDLKDFLQEKKKLSRNHYLACGDFKVGEKFIHEIDQIQLYEKLGNISCPILFLHGDKDCDVPFEQSQKAYKIVSSKVKQIHIIPGADHCFRNEQEEVIDITINFLKGLNYSK